MVRYWTIAPADYNYREYFEQCWQYDRQHGIIAIGWDVGTPASLSDLETKYEAMDRREGWGKSGYHQLKKFWFEIQPGDRIIARAGRKRIVGVGTVTGEPYFDPRNGPSTWGANFLPVRWDDLNEKEFGKQVFGMQTVTSLPEEKFYQLTGDSETSPVQRNDPGGLGPDETGLFSEDQDTDIQLEFALEKYLEEFIVSNFDAIFGDSMVLYQDPEGGDGRQYLTDVGIIDILGWEPEQQTYVVMELKRGKSSDVVVGQILRYMGWVREHLCDPGQGVRGVIICKDRDDRLDYALAMVEKVEAKFYQFNFALYSRPYS